jgi:hypothetical protein
VRSRLGFSSFREGTASLKADLCPRFSCQFVVNPVQMMAFTCWRDLCQLRIDLMKVSGMSAAVSPFAVNQ